MTDTTDKSIKVISAFIGALFFFQLYKEFGMLRFMFTDDGARWDLSMVFYFLPFILLPTAGILFWLRKKIGWILSAIYFSYTAAGAIPMFIMQLERKPTGISALDTLFPTTSPTVHIGTFLFFGAMTWALCKENIRAVYQVDRQSMLLVLGIGIGIILLMALTFGL